jgi:peptidoglycan/xylan/chitin deacetylase (PgdA/CDA1 family)
MKHFLAGLLTMAAILTTQTACSPFQNGAICLTFDDRNFNDWNNAIPLFEKYNAHATFFVCGIIDDKAVATMKRLQENGHSIGLHTIHHANAPESFMETGEDNYMKTQVIPQLFIARQAGLRVNHFAYPNNRRNEDTDRAMHQYFRYLRAGVPGGTKGKDLRKVDAMYCSLDDVRKNRVMGGAGIGSYYETDPEQLKGAILRAAQENKVITFFSHGISDNPNQISISIEWLELILKTAQEHGVKVIGFDELD